MQDPRYIAVLGILCSLFVAGTMVLAQGIAKSLGRVRGGTWEETILWGAGIAAVGVALIGVLVLPRLHRWLSSISSKVVKFRLRKGDQK